MEKEQKDVTILFVNLCDFDKLLQEKHKGIVDMLDQLYRIFDDLCIIHGVQKIEVIILNYNIFFN